MSLLTCPLPPLCHRVSQSFALPPATKPVSHLPCPLPPNQSVIWLAFYHCITMLVSHLPCLLPPNQSVICLAPCHQTNQSFDLPSTLRHQTSQSFALPPATKPVSHLTLPHATKPISLLTCALPPCHTCYVTVICTVSPCHRITAWDFASPPHGYESDWLILPNTVPHHCITASPCHRVTVPPHHCITASPHHRITASLCHCITAWDFPHNMGMNLIG